MSAAAWAYAAGLDWPLAPDTRTSTTPLPLPSVCRVAVAGTHVVDYVGTRPDATTEAAMDRILDRPLPTWDPEVTIGSSPSPGVCVSVDGPWLPAGGLYAALASSSGHVTPARHPCSTSPPHAHVSVPHDRWAGWQAWSPPLAPAATPARAAPRPQPASFRGQPRPATTRRGGPSAPCHSPPLPT